MVSIYDNSTAYLLKLRHRGRSYRFCATLPTESPIREPCLPIQALVPELSNLPDAFASSAWGPRLDVSLLRGLPGSGSTSKNSHRR